MPYFLKTKVMSRYLYITFMNSFTNYDFRFAKLLNLPHSTSLDENIYILRPLLLIWYFCPARVLRPRHKWEIIKTFKCSHYETRNFDLQCPLFVWAWENFPRWKVLSAIWVWPNVIDGGKTTLGGEILVWKCGGTQTHLQTM